MSGEENGKRKSIKRRLIFSMVALAVAITVLCGAALSTVLYRSNVANMEDRVLESAKAYDKAVGYAIQNYVSNIEGLAQDPKITDESMSVEERKAFMMTLAASRGFSEMNTADQYGFTTDGIDISTREYFTRAMAGESYISSPLLSKKDNTMQLFMATKINNGTSYKGIAFYLTPSDTFSEMIDDVSIGDSGFGYIVDKNGVVVAHPDRENVANFLNYITLAEADDSYADMAAVTQKMIAGETGISHAVLDGTKLTVGHMPIPGTDGWSIAVCAVDKEMMQSFYSGLMITLGLIVLFIALSVVMSLMIAKPITNPIVLLVRRIELLAEGDLHTEVPRVNTGDELETLSVSFKHTVDTLRGYVGEISHLLDSMQKGDMTVESEQDYRGDFTPIKTALKGILINMNGVFGNIVESVEQVASGAEQVSATAQSMAQGATEQASAVEELSATVTDIAGEVGSNAENAAKADALSQQSFSKVERGNRQMQEMVQSMSEISKTSAQIEAIIKTIEDIAFQTNILALNASVEAARAGMHGKGFAVVAEEVKNLATKSAAAAKDTNALIKSSIAAVDHGSKIASDTADSLSEIIKISMETKEMIAKISAASGAQATALEQVNQGVDQISSVIQVNSASSEESAATSEELNSQAQMMKQTISFLKLKEK